MLPDRTARRYPHGVTSEEFHKLLEIRREALEVACQEPGTLMPIPVQWRWGWKARVRLQGRDRDGSLKAHIVVTGPRGESPYVRKVRLCKQHTLNLGGS